MRTIPIALCAFALLFATAGHAQAAPPAAKQAVDWPGTSLFHLEQKWVDQNEVKRALPDFAGKFTVVALIFTHCRYSCPITIAHLKSLEAELTPAEKAKVQFVLVSLDPERDKPAVLKAFAKKNGLDEGRWSLLHGAANDVRSLSVALQMRYKETGKGEFSHGRAITILGPRGAVAYQGQKTDEELAVLRAP